MSAISVVYWICWVLWAFFGVRRNYPFTGPWISAGGDILLVILTLIIGLTLFPIHL